MCVVATRTTICHHKYDTIELGIMLRGVSIVEGMGRGRLKMLCIVGVLRVGDEDDEDGAIQIDE